MCKEEAGPVLVQAAGFAITVAQTITESRINRNSALSDKKRVFLVGYSPTVPVLGDTKVISVCWCWRALGGSK